MSAKPTFFAELQRRHVYKVGAMYCVAGWLLVQIVTQVLPVFDVSALGQRILVLIVVAGFPVALVLAWLFDITPEGIVRTPDAPAAGESRQRRGMERKLNYVLGALLGLALGYVVLERTVLREHGGAAAAGNDKSIAVLPFANLSDDKANAYFASGIQDEILTRLAKIGALKVISRTSTQHYASSPDNLPQIARELGVANILEGSVQKIGDAVHVNVQLIRAATDEHLWAESYNRKLDDVFGVEGEVAQTIAERMNAALSGGDRQALATVPTSNPQAYDAYLRGVALATEFGETRSYFDTLIGYYGRAVELDPGFALAWAKLSRAHIEQYFVNDHTPAQLAASKQALDTALRLQPELPEAWISLGYYRYWGDEDYPGALEAYAHAATLLPNNAVVTELIGLVQRRQGRWDESLVNLEKAVELDPRNNDAWANVGFSNLALRRNPEARAAFTRALELQPGDPTMQAFIAQAWLAEGNLDAAGQALANWRIDPQNGETGDIYTQYWRCRRDYAPGIAAWDQVLAEPGKLSPLELASAHAERGSLEWAAGQTDRARADADAARQVLEDLQRKGDSGPIPDVLLGIVHAMLGNKAEALRHARAALDKARNDAFSGSYFRINLAVVETLNGDADAALADIEAALREPGDLNVGNLRLDPVWDPLRADPRFQKLVAGGGA